jgi:3-hydroxyacyl-CoA dehydrogenase
MARQRDVSILLERVKVGNETVFVVGAGTMGNGLAALFAKAGHKVLLYSRSQSTRDAAKGKIQTLFESLAKDKVIRKSEIAPALDLIELTAELDAVSQAEYAIENVKEDLDLKRQIFAELDKLAPPTTILATNTTSFTLSALKSALQNRERFLTWHFYNPPTLIPLVEIAHHDETAQWALDKSKALLEQVGKVPVFCKDATGYIAVRLQYALVFEAISMLEKGIASAEDIDKAVRSSIGLRFATLGPLEIADRGGLDIWYAGGQNLFKAYGDNKFKAPQLLEDMIAKGDLGVKTGHGFHGDEKEMLAAGRDRSLLAMIQLMGLLPKIEDAD